MEENDKLVQLYSAVGLKGDGTFDMYDAAKKAIYHRKNFSAFLEGRDFEIQPVTVEVVPSLDCPFNCPKCTYTQNRSKEKDLGKKRLMTQDVFDSIIDGLKDMYTRSIILTGGGEPIENSLCLSFMKQAIDEGFEVGLFTNGALLNEETIEQLLSMKPNYVRVSLNAGTPRTHSIMCGYKEENSQIFEKITRNVIALGKTKKRMNISTTIGIGYIISEKNYFELDDISKLLLKLYEEADGGIDYVAFRPEVYYFDSNLNSVVKQPNAEIFAKIPNQLERRVGDKLRPSGMRVLIHKDGFEDLSKSFQNTPNIATPWSASFDYDGKFYIMSERNGMEGFCMGDVKEQSVQEIWKGDARRKLMEKMVCGEIRNLPYYKLKTLNDLLWRIKSIGKFSPEEVNEFYETLGIKDIPSHAVFI